MKTNNYVKMVRDGEDFIQIIQKAPEDKQALILMMAEAFLAGLTTGERVAAERAGQPAEERRRRDT